ncbi:porin [Cupriavidus necator]|uniref:Porin, Gram-negative type n=1 Tax=Cupriavidus pinatubonensis (strain JMP 134 / LMG 1197) TaxID=264198 RepID=Q46MJ5_CUPPJ|nr:porin [Cupriavidus necator]
MKLRHLALMAAFALPLVAEAQSVTLYGVVDSSVEYINHVGTARDSVVKMPNLTGTVPSRWGLRGTEDLGGGLKANFVLESGFAPDSGTSNQGGRLFGRQAWVGLSGNWGQLSFGRQYTMLFWATLDTDILGPNAYGSSSLDTYLPNARADNSVAYKGKFGGFTVGATYSFGRDTVNAGPSPSGANCAGENPADKTACREWSALLGYETNWWGVLAAYDSLRGGPGAFGGLTSSSMKDDRAAIGGYMIVDKAKIGAGWIGRHSGATGLPSPRSNMFYAGVAYDITPAITLAGEAFYLKYRNSDDKAWLGVVRASYAFSKRTSVYSSVGYIDNGGNSALSVDSGSAGVAPARGGSQLGVMAGVKHIF